MRRWPAALILCFALALAGPPSAATPALAQEEEPSDPEAMVRDSLEGLMRALEAFIDMIPQYEMPEINENGDIIIRRKHKPETEPEDESDPDLDETRT